MSPVRILHFSDIHLGLKDFHFSYLFDKRFFGRLNQFATRQRKLAADNLNRLAETISSNHYDYVICTGDLASIGSKEEFQHARRMLRPVLEASGGHFLYVPGNHDAYVARYHDALAEIFSQLNPMVHLPLAELPCAVETEKIQFILLNPARPCKIWQSTGELTAAAWEKLDYILEQARPNGKNRILISHFPLLKGNGRPLSWRARLLQGERLFRHAALKHFDALLTGHVHFPFILNATQDHPLFVGAGSLTIRNSYATLEISDSGTIIDTAIHLLT